MVHGITQYKKDKFYLKSGTVNKNISYGSNISVGSSMVNKMNLFFYVCNDHRQ